MKKNPIGALAPARLPREFWVELVESTLHRPLAGDEHEVIICAYERDCATRRLDPGVVIGMIFPQIVSADGLGCLEVEATSLASDNYGYEVVDEKEVVWDAIVTSSLVPAKEGGK